MAAPVGPVGILSLKRIFSSGHLCGLASGLGISTADAIYGFLAAFGLTSISNFLLTQQLGLRIIGGLILCALGIKTYFTSFSKKLSPFSDPGTYFGAYFSALLLTLLNPMLILSFAALFAGLGLVNQSTNQMTALAIVSGVFCGSAIWWVFLSGMVSMLSMKFNDTLIQKINHFSGILIVCFGVVVLGSAIFI
jgi:threonine/homoserine/homoserine lactone efflux protein